MNTLQLSVVIPVYNSEATLEELHARLTKVLSGESAYEIILVDDGSKDGSWKKIEQIKKNDPTHVVAISLARNFGQHNALVCGFGNCSSAYVITMDDDLQHPPEEIPKLLACRKEKNCDIVYGIYEDRKHGMIRSAGSLILRRSSKYVEKTVGEGSSFRVIRREITDKIVFHHSTNFIFIDEVLQWYTQDIATVQVEHHARKAGRSTYTSSKLFSLWLDISFNYSAIPLRMMTWIGLSSSLITFLIGLRFLLRRLFFKVPLGYTSIIVSVLFSASLIMLSLGVVGQYLYKLFTMQNKRPIYSIKKILR